MLNWQADRVEDGRYSLVGLSVATAEGVQVYVGGGERPHVGAVAVSEPRPSLKGDGSRGCTTSVLSRLAHKDGELAVPLAEALCLALGQPVVVTAGVHLDDAGPDDIKRLLANSVRLQVLLLRRLGEQRRGP